MTPVLGIIASSNQQGRGGVPVGSYDALASIIVGSSGVTEILFAGVPTDYRHLQIRASVLGSSLNQDILAQFNGVSSASYSLHEMRGNGSTVLSSAGANTTGFYIATNALTTNYPTALVMDILDYANTTKNKTARILQGKNSNGSGSVSLFSGLFYGTTEAVTSIRIYNSGGNFNQYSSFALYGVK